MFPDAAWPAQRANPIINNSGGSLGQSSGANAIEQVQVDPRGRGGSGGGGGGAIYVVYRCSPRHPTHSVLVLAA
jgi:hypothetical protein